MEVVKFPAVLGCARVEKLPVEELQFVSRWRREDPADEKNRNERPKKMKKRQTEHVNGRRFTKKEIKFFVQWKWGYGGLDISLTLDATHGLSLVFGMNLKRKLTNKKRTGLLKKYKDDIQNCLCHHDEHAKNILELSDVVTEPTVISAEEVTKSMSTSETTDDITASTVVSAEEVTHSMPTSESTDDITASTVVSAEEVTRSLSTSESTDDITASTVVSAEDVTQFMSTFETTDDITASTVISTKDATQSMSTSETTDDITTSTVVSAEEVTRSMPTSETTDDITAPTIISAEDVTPSMTTSETTDDITTSTVVSTEDVTQSMSTFETTDDITASTVVSTEDITQSMSTSETTDDITASTVVSTEDITQSMSTSETTDVITEPTVVSTEDILFKLTFDPSKDITESIYLSENKEDIANVTVVSTEVIAKPMPTSETTEHISGSTWNIIDLAKYIPEPPEDIDVSTIEPTECMSSFDSDEDPEYVPESDSELSEVYENGFPDISSFLDEEDVESDIEMNIDSKVGKQGLSCQNSSAPANSFNCLSKGSNISDKQESCIIIEYEHHSTTPPEKIPLAESQLKENERLYDINYPEMFIKKYEKKVETKNGRPYDKRHSCYFCGKLKTNIQTHFEHGHKSAEEVKTFVKMKQDIAETLDADKKKSLSEQLHRLQAIVRNKGNHIHNEKVWKQKRGEILLARRPPVFDCSKYGPCPKCHEWIILENITKHQRSCVANEVSTDKPNSDHEFEEAMTKGASIVQMKVLKGQITTRPSKKLEKEVFPSMTRDDLTECAQNDDLIVALGEIWFMKNVGNRLRRKNFTSFRMRLAARLLLLMRDKLELKELTMSSILVPTHFDLIVESSLDVCKENQENELQNPSTGIKLGYDLSRLASLKLGFSIKASDEKRKQEASDFLRLMQLEWSVKVTKLARVTLEERRFNKGKDLPHPEDIVQLTTYMVEALKALDLSKPDEAVFREAVILTQARLLVYNRRRPGELESLRVDGYLGRSSLDETDLSLRQSLSDFEKKLLQTQDLVEIRGKTGRGVPVLLPKESQRVLDFLSTNSCRKQGGVKEQNPYMFANKSSGVVRAGDALNEIKERLGSKLKFPKRILATNLRKHTATIAQVLGLDEHEMKWLCNHLGHTRRVHDQYYRQTSGIIERIDIAKLMIMQEHNLVGKYANKSLSEIQFDELMDDDNSATDGSRSEETHDNFTASFEDVMGFDDGGMGQCGKKKSNPHKRLKWSKEEEIEIHQYFKQYFSRQISKTCPSQFDCKAAIAKSRENKGQLQQRTWETIKKKVARMLKNNVRV